MGLNNSIQMAMHPTIRQLHIAVMRNDVETVQELVQMGIDVNHPWINNENPSVKDGSTPLCEAVSLNHRQVVEALLVANASVNQRDYYECTPLHKAAYHGRHILIQMLIEAGADVHNRDNNLNTPLHICVQNAIVHNNAQTVRVLIKAGASVNTPNKYGKIPLHYAALWGLREISEILLKAHSEIDHPDLKWRTPLYCCIRPLNAVQRKREVFLQHVPAIKVLIRSGCDTLNLATWMCKYNIMDKAYPTEPYISEWYVSAQPECLKQLCRLAIQRHFGYPDGNAASIRVLPLPKVLVDYLLRKLL